MHRGIHNLKDTIKKSFSRPLKQSTGRTMSSFFPAQENLQDTKQSPTRLAVRIFKGKNQRLASSSSDKEVGYLPSHLFQQKINRKAFYFVENIAV